MSSNPPEPDLLSFVEQTHARELGRAVDPAGLRKALDRLAQGMTREDLALTLRLSDEAARHWRREPVGCETTALAGMLQAPPERFVAWAYRQLYARAVDGSGMRHRAQAVRRGDSRLLLLLRWQGDDEARGQSRRVLTSGTFLAALRQAPLAVVRDTLRIPTTLARHVSASAQRRFRSQGRS